ncbi:Glyoxalase/fosfomycin resistance/dioxygenase domain containing protein [Spirosomataceae bacterium]|jgi:lactoylglutathione lyase
MPKIEHVAMYCQNLETIKDFYEKYFGCKSGPKYTNSKKGFESYFLSFEDGSRLGIMHKTSVNESINPRELMGLTHLAIIVGCSENVDKLKKNLKAIAMR